MKYLEKVGLYDRVIVALNADKDRHWIVKQAQNITSLEMYVSIVVAERD